MHHMWPPSSLFCEPRSDETTSSIRDMIQVKEGQYDRHQHKI